MDYTYLFICIGIMALVTYLPRMLPLVIFKKQIKNRYIKSFLAYVPYAVLAAMAFPSVLHSTANITSGIVGMFAALLLAYYKKSLLIVAIGAVLAVFICEQAMLYI